MKQLCLVLSILCLIWTTQTFNMDYTQIPQFLQSQVKSNPSFHHSAWKKLAYFTDTFGPRMWGSQQQQEAILKIYNQAQQDGFQNVHLEPVSNFTKWIRGSQSLTMYSPRPRPSKIEMIGLGRSVGGDIYGQVIVVESFNQLQRRKGQINGKIVCYNPQWNNYPSMGPYRVNGASRAAKYGASAVLVRSVSPDLDSLHTGYMQYQAGINKIPAAAIKGQDAKMFKRMQDRNQKIMVHLQMQNQFVPKWNSSSPVFQIVGSKYPNQIVLAGGHIDTWDTGAQTGANDDGGGFITVYEALRLLKWYNFVPKRTIRFIAWSGEEQGTMQDANLQYVQQHKQQLKYHIAAFESDGGSMSLYGFGHQGSGTEQFKKILKYLQPIGAGTYSDDGYSADVYPLFEQGVPIIRNLIKDTADDSFYYTYHHSSGDSMEIMDPDQLDENVVGIASLLYLVADMQDSLRQVPKEIQLQA